MHFDNCSVSTQLTDKELILELDMEMEMEMEIPMEVKFQRIRFKH